MPIESILIPVDGSKHSEYACEMAYKLVQLVPGQESVHLVHCIEPIPGLIGGDKREKLEKDYADEAEKIFAPCLKIFSKLGNPCQTHLVYGKPGEAIAELAEKLHCTLIVMGTRGRSNIKSMVLGSVSSHVLEHAKIPVLLARPR